MINISEIYQKYDIMPVLALHQIRVAGVALAICDSLEEKVDKESIVLACLLHDLGNIVKADLDYFEESILSNKKYWQEVKEKYVNKYGDNDHIATEKMAKELNLPEKIIYLINTIDSKKAELINNTNILEDKICFYADNRVSPYEILSIEERSEEFIKRNMNNKFYTVDIEKRNYFLENLKEIEKQIFSKSKLNKEDINNNFIEPYIQVVRNKFFISNLFL